MNVRLLGAKRQLITSALHVAKCYNGVKVGAMRSNVNLIRSASIRNFHTNSFSLKDEDDKKKEEEVEDDIVEDDVEKKDEKDKKKDESDDEIIEEARIQEKGKVPNTPSTKKSKKNGDVIAPSRYSDAMSIFDGVPTPQFVDVLPLYKRPMFPGTMVPIVVSDRQLASRAIKAGAADQLMGLFYIRGDEERAKEGPDVASITSDKDIEVVGTLARITRVNAAKGDSFILLVVGIRRIKVVRQVESQGPMMRVQIEEIKPKKSGNDQVIKAYSLEALNCLKEFTQYNSLNREQFQRLLEHHDINEPDDLADICALLSSPSPAKLQDILATVSTEERLVKTVTLMKQELETLRMQSKISKNLEERVSTAQRKYYLNEQLKLIKKELGLEHDEKDAIMEKFNARIKDKNVPEAAQKVIQEELMKLSTLEPSSSEFNVCRNYLDWLTVLPWGVEQEENFDLKHAQTVLDEDHFGLQKLKERILEFIAVGKMKGTVQGKIICFVGPPGVGKTSIGKSIARALKREYFRFSVGGMSDVSEIKGHRRTYIGAMPGKLIQVMKLAKSSNPVIMIDEIDKLGKGHGDPSSALLEVLDPEQNDSFLDHYLDVPFDLSKVLFVCTANVLDTIPRPLLDRMEVLRISGYILQEKMSIAKKYLIPKLTEDCGVNHGEVQVTDKLLEGLIRDYCRESGVRNLQKHIEKILRKATYKIVLDQEAKEVGKKKKEVKKDTKKVVEKEKKKKQLAKPLVVLDEGNLEELVGKPNFSSDRYYFRTPVGVVMGLAWTSMGGSTLYIETTVEVGNEKSTSLKVTGKIGEVMKESSSIAYTYAKSHYDKVKNFDNRWSKKKETEQAIAEGEKEEPVQKSDFFGKNSIHMHIPEGATPKDGPSAGITMVTALLSLAYDRPVKHGLAMTGEITLTGKVLEIGGVKEKTIAARRSGVTEIIMPSECKKEWEELDKEIKEGLIVHFADYYDDVHKIAFEYDDDANKLAMEKEKEEIKTNSPKLAEFFKL